jgi:hypothetical protein
MGCNLNSVLDNNIDFFRKKPTLASITDALRCPSIDMSSEGAPVQLYFLPGFHPILVLDLFADFSKAHPFSSIFLPLQLMLVESHCMSI